MLLKYKSAQPCFKVIALTFCANPFDLKKVSIELSISKLPVKPILAFK